jgi:hypothetical protein
MSTIGLLFGALAVVATLLRAPPVSLGLGGFAYWIIVHSVYVLGPILGQPTVLERSAGAISKNSE